jgi:hypothetical protein
MPAEQQVAFPAVIHSLKVGMSYGDKEGTLVIKFRPEGTTVEDLNALTGNDQTVMVAIVPISEDTEKNESHEISKRTRANGRKAQGGEV